MGLLPLPPSPPLSTNDDIPGPPILMTKDHDESGPSTIPTPISLPLSQSSQATTIITSSTATPPTSPLPIPPYLKATITTGSRKRKRRRNSLDLDEFGVDRDSDYSYSYSASTSNSDEEFLPSPAASTSTSTTIASTSNTNSTRTNSQLRSHSHSLRGGGKRPPAKSRKQNPNHASTPNSQGSSVSVNPGINGKLSKRQQKLENDRASSSRRTTRSKAKRASSPSDLVTTSLEEIALEDTAVKAEISRLGLTLRDVKGDGNCLFRVLSDQGFGGEKRHAEIRKLVCDYLETHKDVMEGFVVPFMKDGEGYEGYVARMRQLKQFGSHIEIQAAARVFKRNIRVVMSTTSFTIPWQTEASTNKDPPATPSPADVGPVPTTPSHSTRSKTVHTPHAPSIPLPDYLPHPREDRSMIWLALFSQAEHFQSIRRMGDREHGPAEVEDKLSIPHARDVSEAARRERGELVDEKTPKTPLSLSAKITQLLNSLPMGHGVTPDQAQSVLGRTHGDIGEAVEILLEEIAQDKEGDSGGTTTTESDSGSSDHVEQMLLSPKLHSSTQLNSIVGQAGPPQEYRDHVESGQTSRSRSKISASPSTTATSSTESRSRSRSRSRSGARSDDTSQSGNTSQTEPFEDSKSIDSPISTQTTTILSDNMKEMKVECTPDLVTVNIPGTDTSAAGQSPVKAVDSQKKPKERRRSSIHRDSIAASRGERRRSARLGTVGA